VLRLQATYCLVPTVRFSRQCVSFCSRIWTLVITNLCCPEVSQKPYSGGFLLFKRQQTLSGRYRDPRYGWSDVVRGEFEVYNLSSLEQIDIFRSKPDREIIANAPLNSIDQIIDESSARLTGVA
jgi:hypothetical protein